MTKFFYKDGNAVFIYTISHSVMEEKWFSFKSFHRFISENLSSQFSMMQEGENINNQKDK